MKTLLLTLFAWMVALPAMAATDGAHGNGSYTIIMMVVLIAVFYFMLIRPQMKRNKAQKQMMSNLEAGAEVMTQGGIIGKITKVSDSYFKVLVADGVEMQFQKQSVASVLPKGTVEFKSGHTESKPKKAKKS